MERSTTNVLAWLAALLLAAHAAAMAPMGEGLGPVGDGAPHPMATARAAATMVPIEEGYVPVGGGVELYYRKLGEGAPDLIVTNHVAAAVPLSGLAAGHTVVFYDTRGRGLSTMVRDPEQLGMEHEIADIGAVQDHFGGEPAVVAGWSLWGGFVQLYAARNPDKVRGVIALGPVELAAEPYAGMPFLKDGPDFEALEAYWSSLPEDAPGYEACLGAYDIIHASQVADASAALIPELNRRVCALRTEWDDNVMATIGPLFESMGAWDWRDEVAGLQAPLLIVHGDQDTVIPEAIDANASLVPDAEVVVIEDAGHMGFVEHPERYVEIVGTFLGSLP